MIDKLSKTAIVAAQQESIPVVDYKAAKEILRERQATVDAEAAALIQTLAADEPIVIGSGPTAALDLMDWLDR